MTANLRAFLERSATDETLRQRLAAIKPENREQALSEVAAIATEAGFPLTHEDLNSFPEEDELTLDQLDQVSGGNRLPLMFLMPLPKLIDEMVALARQDAKNEEDLRRKLSQP